MFHELVASAYRQITRENQELKAEIERLRQAVADHHCQQLDDLCILDDNTLYQAFGLPARIPVTCDEETMIANCRQFIRNRCIAGSQWPSYQELRTHLVRMLQVARPIVKNRKTYREDFENLNHAYAAALAVSERLPPANLPPQESK